MDGSKHDGKTAMNETLSRGCGGFLGVLWVLGCLALTVGCAEDGPEELYAAAQRAAEDSTAFDRAQTLYGDFLKKYPAHDLAPAALKQLAVIAQQQSRMEEAIALYEKLLAQYPQSAEGDEAQFMIAFICEEYLRDYGRARQAYEQVIQRYPQSELAASARRLLPHVGRAPEEWVDFQDDP